MPLSRSISVMLHSPWNASYTRLAPARRRWPPSASHPAPCRRGLSAQTTCCPAVSHARTIFQFTGPLAQRARRACRHICHFDSSFLHSGCACVQPLPWRNAIHRAMRAGIFPKEIIARQQEEIYCSIVKFSHGKQSKIVKLHAECHLGAGSRPWRAAATAKQPGHSGVPRLSGCLFACCPKQAAPGPAGGARLLFPCSSGTRQGQACAHWPQHFPLRNLHVKINSRADDPFQHHCAPGASRCQAQRHCTKKIPKAYRMPHMQAGEAPEVNTASPRRHAGCWGMVLESGQKTGMNTRPRNSTRHTAAAVSACGAYQDKISGETGSSSKMAAMVSTMPTCRTSRTPYWRACRTQCCPMHCPITVMASRGRCVYAA